MCSAGGGCTREPNVVILRNRHGRCDRNSAACRPRTRFGTRVTAKVNRSRSDRISDGSTRLDGLPQMSPETFTLCAAIVTAVAAAAGGWLARGSTAVPAAIWATAAALTLAADAGGRAVGWLIDPSARAAARLVVAALAVCPAMSLLGAKRPQHGVWQLIVATLAAVLAMPAASATLVRPGSLPDIHVIERFFLPLLVGVGWLNFIATRRGLAASLVAAGQLGLMWSFLPGGSAADPPGPAAEAAAAGSIAMGAVLAVAQAGLAQRNRGAVAAGLAAAVDPPFLAIRETFGAAWTLRICERFNVIAAARGWPCRLLFGGLEPGAASGSWEREAVRCFRSIVRRFVSAEWIARHAGLPGKR